MNQSDLITKVASITGESKKAVEAVLKTAGDVVTAHLQEGEDVALPGLGKLSVKQRAPATTRKPAIRSRSRPRRCRTSPPQRR